MKIQYQILKKALKKNLIWLLLLLILVGIYNFINQVKQINPALEFLQIINNSPIKEMNTIEITICLYQIILVIYMTYIIYTYEMNNSFQNILLRINEKKWILSKYLILILFIIFYKIIYIYVAFLEFSNLLSLDIVYFIKSIIFDIVICLTTITCINFIKNKYLFLFLLTFLVSILEIKRNLFLNCAIIMILLFINYKNINFHKLIQ